MYNEILCVYPRRSTRSPLHLITILCLAIQLATTRASHLCFLYDRTQKVLDYAPMAKPPQSFPSQKFKTDQQKMNLCVL